MSHGQEVREGEEQLKLQKDGPTTLGQYPPHERKLTLQALQDFVRRKKIFYKGWPQTIEGNGTKGREKMKVKGLIFILINAIFLTSQLPSCSNTYYSFWEKLGKQKRDLLRGHIEKSHEEQKEVGEEVKDALQRLQALAGTTGSDLENEYEKLKTEYEEAEKAAEDLKDRIKKMEKVASDLFEEWAREIPTLKKKEYRDDSRKHLKKTKEKFHSLHQSLKSSERAMAPVLARFKDVVLFLKHRLNASALDSLQGEFKSIEKDIGKLVQRMEKSISEGDRFMETLKD